MIEPLISLTILDFKTQFVGGEVFRWEFQIDAVESNQIVAVENSILWYTTGKGDEDIGVHFFERRVPRKKEDVDLAALRRFENELPRSPLSYDGFLLKINWCVRVRVFFKGGKEVSEEIPFLLKSKSSQITTTLKNDVIGSPFRVVGNTG